MTLEEILNVDWAEQKDLTEYVKHFEDAQLLNAQLAEFTYQYLRAKLIRWDEIVEEGIQNFNFFNFAVSGLRMRDETCYMVIFPSCKVLDTGYRLRCCFFPYNHFRECLEELERDRRYSDTLKSYIKLKAYEEMILERSNWCCDNDFRQELLEDLKNDPLVTVIKHDNTIKADYYINHPPVILKNEDIIKLGIYKNFEELNKSFAADIENCLFKGRIFSGYPDNYYHYYQLGLNLNPDALYYINDFGQPIFLTRESKFGANYNSTKVDLEKNLVTFSFAKTTDRWREQDNSVIYHRGYPSLDEITVDFVEDKIVLDL